MMLWRDIVGLSLQNLSLHKVRSTLTSLGVIFGVGSVIAMLAVSAGAKSQALQQYESMGIDKIIVSSKKPSAEGKDTSSDAGGMFGESYGLTRQDMTNLLKMDNVISISPLWNMRKRVVRGTTRLDLQMVGVGPGFLDDSSSQMDQGRWFNSNEFADKVPVCVLGSEAKRKLFRLSNKSVIGELIKVDDQVYRVIGVLRNEKGTQYSELGSPNDMIFTPLSTAKGLFSDYTLSRDQGRMPIITQIEYDLFIIKVNDIGYIENTGKRIEGYFQKAHAKTKDWDMVIPRELLLQMEATQNIFTVVMSSIAGISLVVGGIGIMNIMLASVFERRKEIGIRRALGAQKGDIIGQFLIETVILTTWGGVCGILLGIGLSLLITHYAEMPVEYSSWSILVSLAISSLVGIVFGTYPAWKAAQQSPIDVLRAE